MLIQFEGGEFEKAKIHCFAASRYLLFSSKRLERRSDTLPKSYKIWDPSKDKFPKRRCGVYYPRLSFIKEDGEIVFEEECFKWNFTGERKKEMEKEVFDYMYSLLDFVKK